MVAGGVHGCWGHAWLLGGMHGCGGHAQLWGACIGYDEIRSISGRYASYWNAFLLNIVFKKWQNFRRNDSICVRVRCNRCRSGRIKAEKQKFQKH